GKTIAFMLTLGSSTTPVGTATTDSSGVATLPNISLAGLNAGTVAGAVSAAFAGDAAAAATTAQGDLVVNRAAATLSLSHTLYTFDGAPHAVTVTTTPPALTGVSVTYKQGSTVVAAPTHGGVYMVTASLSNPNFSAEDAIGSLIISPATP